MYMFWLWWVLLLHAGFLQLPRIGATFRCGARAFHCGGFFCCEAQAVGTQTSVAVACWPWSADSVVVAYRLNIISSYCQTNLCLAIDLADKTCACGNG